MTRPTAVTESTPLGLTEPAEREPGVVDFDLHGFVGIRLVGASAADARAVSKQLGSIRGTVSDPDIVVRFVDRIPASPELRYLGLDDGGFDDDSSYVLRRERKRQLRSRLSLDQVGERCEIVCESGFGAVPLLIPIVNLTALAKGVLPLHASAFTYEGTGVLVTGWAKGGKTEMLLGFMARGGRYVGDEWVYIDAERGRLYGIPEPMRIWDWHLDDLARYRRLLGLRTRGRMWLIKRLVRTMRVLPDPLARTHPGRFANRAVALVERQSFVRIEPERLFGADQCALEGPFDKLIFVVSHDSPEITIEPLDPEDVARRMIFSHEFERVDLTAAYLQSRFAFPDRVNSLLESARELETALLGRALAGKEAYVVRHPFPAPIPALVDAVLPLL